MWFFGVWISATATAVATLSDIPDNVRFVAVSIAVWVGLGVIVIEIRNVGRSIRGETPHD